MSKFLVCAKKKPDSGKEQSREFAEKPDTGEPRKMPPVIIKFGTFAKRNSGET